MLVGFCYHACLVLLSCLLGFVTMLVGFCYHDCWVLLSLIQGHLTLLLIEDMVTIYLHILYVLLSRNILF